jgi:hypothetical protein
MIRKSGHRFSEKIMLKQKDGAFMPPSNAALLRALVRPMAFPHHKAQEITAPSAGLPDARSAKSTFGERCGGE